MKIKLKGMNGEIKTMVESVAYAVELHRLHPDLAGVPAYSSEAQAIAQFFVDGFPKPAGADDPYVPSERADWEEVTQSVAHAAVNINDKYHRENMRDAVTTNLLHSGALSLAERAWLIYVLSKLKELPHESKGRAIKGNERIEFMLQLIGFIEADERKAGKYKPGDVTKRLHDAAEHFGKGFDSVNAMYKSKAFKRLRKNLSDRGNIERALFTKTTI